MDRKEAVNLFRTIRDRIADLCPKVVALTESEPNSGYALQLTGLCDECKKQTIKISHEQGLDTIEDQEKLTIFTPLPK